MQFLMGFNTCYDHIKDQILLMDPLPSLDKTYSMLSSIERQNKVNNSRTIEMTYFVARNPNYGGDGQKGHYAQSNHGTQGGRFVKIDKSNLKCDYCNGTKHTRESCFKLIGYPEWWGERGRSRGRGKLFSNSPNTHANQSSFMDTDCYQGNGDTWTSKQ